MKFITIFYLIVPLILIVTIMVKKASSIFNWALSVFSFGLVMLFLWATTRWEMVSIYLRYIFPLLFLVAIIVGFRKIQKPVNKPSKVSGFINILINLALIIFFSGLNWFTLTGYQKPENTINIASPFHSGKQIVLHGGASPFINGHFHVKPQNYALDLVGLNAMGRRSSQFGSTKDLDKYVIYGDTIYSPVKGVVLNVVNEFADQQPPHTDIDNPAGNYVLIGYDDVEILMAHLREGSILVNVGDDVDINTAIGQVGNTGNTSEPHLHLHIEKGGSPGKILDGSAVPFTIQERFLKRGDILN